MARERNRTAAPDATKEAGTTRQRTRSTKEAAPAPEEKQGRQRNRSSAKDTAPVEKKTSGKDVASPRRKLNLPGRNRRNPAEDSNDAVKILVQAALNANPDLDVVSSGQLNLLLMGSGLATSSAEASVLWQKAVSAGTVIEA